MIISILSQAFAAPLSLDEAVELAMLHNPQLQQVSYDLESSKAQVLSAKSIFDPNLTASAGRNFSTQQQFFAGFGIVNTEFIGPTWAIGSSLTLPTGGTVSLDWTTNQNRTRYTLEDVQIDDQQINPFDTRLSLNFSHNLLDGFGLKNNRQGVTSAERSVEIAQLTLLSTQQQILADVASAYWSAHYQFQLLTIATESIRIAEEEARVVAAQVQEGNLAPVESDRVEAARLSALSAAADAEQAFFTALDSLSLLIGKGLGTNVQLSSNPKPPSAVEMSLERAQQDADRQSPMLRQAEYAVEEAQDQLRLARNKRLPTLSANAQYGLNGWEEELSDAITEMLDASLPSSFIGLNLSIPARRLASKGELGQRIASLERTKIELQSQRQSLQQQVSAQHRTLKASLIKIELAEANLKVAESTLTADRALRDAGRAIEKDVLSSANAVDEAKSQLEKALADYQLAQIELDRLMGALKAP